MQGSRRAARPLAAVETIFALLQSSRLIAPDVPIENSHLAGQITATAHLIAEPVLAIAALVFAARNLLPQAIMALAVIVQARRATRPPPVHGS